MSDTPGNFDPLNAVDARIKAVGYDELNDCEKGYYAVWWFTAETQNGGLHQFFFNSTGGYVTDVRMGLRMMGATETLGILDRALRLFGRADLPRDDGERREIVLKLSPDAEQAMDDLTVEFYNSSEGLYELREAFAASHRAQFGTG